MPVFNAIDYVLMVILLLSALLGVMRGFVREALSLAFWCAAVWVAWRYGAELADGLRGASANSTVRLWLARTGAFLGVVVLGAVVSWLASRLVRSTVLSGSDRLIGMLFGIVRGGVLIALLVWGLRAAGLDHEPWWRESKLLPYAAPAADAVEGAAGRVPLAARPARGAPWPDPRSQESLS